MLSEVQLTSTLELDVLVWLTPVISGVHGAFRKKEKERERVCVPYTSVKCWMYAPLCVHDYTCFMCLWTAGEVAAAYVIARYDDYTVFAVASEV